MIAVFVVAFGEALEPAFKDYIAAVIENAQALADQLEDNEAQGRLAERLLTHPERVARFPEFMSRASQELAPTDPELP